MPIDRILPFDWESLLAGLSRGKTVVEYSNGQRIFDQGQPADSLFFVQNGRVKLSVLAQQGKETVLATMSAGEFFGEGCLADQPSRISIASAITDCSLIRIEKSLMMRVLHENHEISELFVAYLLSRTFHYEASLVNRLFNLGENPLARFLWLLVQAGEDCRFETVLPGACPDSLAKMLGIPRSRIGHYIN